MSSPIFSPISIHTLNVPNRIVLPAMVTNYGARNGEVTDRLIRYHVERARGGCGLNILEATCIDRSGLSFARGLALDCDAMIPSMRRLTEAVHSAGGLIAVQLQHGGRCALPHFSGQPRLVVSQIPDVTGDEECKELTNEDIHRLIHAYGNAAYRAKLAGFDAVEIHGAHGYLILQFLSPHTNQRQDAWGGTPEKRLTFAIKTIHAIREKVGSNYPLLFRLSVDELIEGGLTLDMACSIAKALTSAGINAIHVSVACPETNQFVTAPACIPMGWNADRAAAIKEAVGKSIPVIVVGRIHNRAVAEKILHDGKADMLAVGRAQIADPCFVNKLKNNRDDAIVPCMSCNDGCISFTARGECVTCAVNPRAGHEGLLPNLTTTNPKHILIIGAGPAGMTAATTAAERGHYVTLLEKSGKLGGLLNIACLPPHKHLYKKLILSMEHRLAALGVDIHLHCEATLDIIRKLSPDVIIAATGSVPIIPKFCIKAAPRLHAAEDVLQGTPVGNNVAVLGGGLVGCETAEFLAEKEHQVTILELRDSLAPDLETRTRRLLLPRMEKLGINVMLQCEIISISEDGRITIRNRFHLEKELPIFDSIVLALGYHANQRLHPLLEECSIPVHYIGDCARAGKVISAVHSGFETAYSL